MNEPFAGRVVSLQVGRPKKMTTAAGKVWESAIAKEPVSERIALVGENLVGDYQANRKYHGGPDKAVCAYSAEHFPAWAADLGRELPFGAFGENITVDGLTEDKVCIGDIFAIGTALVQVSQPRQPCANISKRWTEPSLPRRMEETGRTGFYLRIVREGEIGPGDAIILTERPHPDWPLSRANAIMYGPASDRAAIDALRAVDALSAEWKRILGRKA